MKDIANSLPIVARAIGEKMNVTVTVGGDRACTNGEAIMLPTLPETAEAKILARGYLDHEAAHIKFTDFNVKAESLTNAIEDIRIEELVGAKYPGSKKNLENLSDYLVKAGKIKVSEEDNTVGLAGMYANQKLRADRLGHEACRDVAEQAAGFLRSRLGDSVLSELDKAIQEPLSSTQDSEKVARKIREIIKKALQEQQEQGQGQDQDQNQQDQQDQEAQQGQGQGQDQEAQQGQEDSDEGESSEGSDDAAGADQEDGSQQEGAAGEDESGDSDGSQDSEGSNDEQGGSGDSDQEDEESSANSGQEESPQKSGQNSGTRESSAGSSSDDPGQEDEEASSKAKFPKDNKSEEPTSSETGDEDPSFTGLGELAQEMLDEEKNKLSKMERREDAKEIATPLPPREFLKKFSQLTSEMRDAAMRESSRMRKKLQGILESKRRDRERTCRAGKKFSTKDLHRLGVKDTRIFSRQQERNGVNTAIHILLDASGSMQGDQSEQCVKAGYALGHALDRVPHVSFAISAFPMENPLCPAEFQVEKLKEFGERFKEDTLGSYRADGGCTPTLPSMRYAAYTLAFRPEERKLLFIITDGRPNEGGHSLAVAQYDEWLNKNGIEVVAIGIREDSVKRIHKQGVVINALSELPSVLFNLMARKA